MIELLTMLDTKGSCTSLSQMQNSGSFPADKSSYNTTQVCPACKNTSKTSSMDCWRCGGAKKIRNVRQAESQPAYRAQQMDASYVASLCSGIEEYKFYAGLVHICHCQDSATKLAYYIAQNVLSKKAATWRLDAEKASDRVAGIAQAALIELSIYPDKLNQSSSAKIVGVTRQSWKETWQQRQYDMFSQMKSWCDDLDSHMLRRHRGAGG